MSSVVDAGAREAAETIDVHQHLWGPRFVEALRQRDHAPYLRDWTLHTEGEPPYAVDPVAHDVPTRTRRELDEGKELVCVSLSSPLEIERMPDSNDLLDAFHDDALELPEPWAAWASVSAVDPDLTALKRHLHEGFVGLQVPADAVASPSGWEAKAPVLDVVAEAGASLFVHPGPVVSPAGAPDWWAPVVGYVDQLVADWWGWHAVGRQVAPDLRVCFAAGGGLAAVHHERLVARGGDFAAVDPDVFVETSSYGPRALDALIRVLGIDVVVRGSDRPYADPSALDLGEAAARAVDTINPRRLLTRGGSR